MNVALIHNWPNLRNSELDLIGRIFHVLAQIGHDSVIIDPFGNLLDSDGNLKGENRRIEPTDFDFCINFHYTNPNFLDCFSYIVNWNPYEYIVRDPATSAQVPQTELLYLASCLRTHDIVLSAGSVSTDRLVAALADRQDPGQHFPDLRLNPTCQLFLGMEPVSLEDFRVFYIGINWERLADRTGSGTRHGGLLELLDETGRVDFYGVREMYGINPWQGFTNYRGELPFDDGLSIVRTANQCGVSLVLSSPSHRDSGVVSTRIFQACAARTVVISDDNPFITREFGDAVLTFSYTDDGRQAFERIRTLIQWIEDHPEEAADKAERAHRIFADRFSLDREIGYLLENHETHRALVEEQCLPVDRSQTVDVVFHMGTYNEGDLEVFLSNLNRQSAVSIHALVGCAADDEDLAAGHLEGRASFEYSVLVLEPDERTAGSLIFRGVVEHGRGNCFCVYRTGETWTRHHIAHLLRTMQNGSALASQTHGYFNNLITASHPYDRSLSSLAIGCELTCLRPDHLASFAVSAFSPASFLFHKKLLVNHYDRAQHVMLFHHAAYFYLLLLNYVVYRTLPGSTARLTQSYDRADDLFSLYDCEDASFLDGLNQEIVTLGALFRFSETGRELATLALALQASGEAGAAAGLGQHGMYSYLVKTFRNRPRLLRALQAIYKGTRFVLRLPPHPPKRA